MAQSHEHTKTMYILALDTATDCGGAALSRDDEVMGMLMLKRPLCYSEKILHLVDFLLGQHELQLEKIDCFAVAAGPGSFTGLRIGLATVKAFCQALERPAVGISTLEALAYRFRWAHSRVAPVMDARREQVFAAVYRVDEARLEIESGEQVSAPAEWLKNIRPGNCVFVGDGARRYRQQIQATHPKSRVLDSDNRILDQLCQLAYARFREGKAVPAEKLSAHYVRPSDAELSRSHRKHGS